MITSSEDIMNSLLEGNKRRTTESTGANEVSSWSHAVLIITVENKAKDSQNSEMICSKLNFIDLAGSEWAAAT